MVWINTSKKYTLILYYNEGEYDSVDMIFSSVKIEWKNISEEIKLMFKNELMKFLIEILKENMKYENSYKDMEVSYDEESKKGRLILNISYKYENMNVKEENNDEFWTDLIPFHLVESTYIFDIEEKSLFS